MFKIVASIITGVAMVFAPVVTTHAAASATAFVSPASGTYTKGNVFSVSIYEDSGDNDVDSARANLTYDTSKLEAQSISAGDFNTCVTAPSAGGGSINTGDCTVLGGKKRGQVRLATVSFKAIAEGTAAVNFSSAKVVNGGTDLPVTLVNASFTVAAPATGGMGGGSAATNSTASTPAAANKVATTTPVTGEGQNSVSTDEAKSDTKAADTAKDTKKDDTKAATNSDAQNTSSKRNIWPMIIILLIAATAAAYAYRNRSTGAPVKEETAKKDTKNPIAPAEAVVAAPVAKKLDDAEKAVKKPQQNANRNKKAGHKRPSNKRTR